MLVLVVILLLALSRADAQQSLSMSHSIGVLAVDVSTPVHIVYASAGPGLHRSTDEGLTWEPVYFRPAGQRQPVLTQILVHPTVPGTAYAFTDADDGGVWKTIDGGSSWTMSNTGLPAGGTIVGPAIMLADRPQTLYAKVGEEFYKTTDGAGSWSRLGTLLSAGLAYTVDHSDPTRMYASGGSAVWRSTNEGAVWSIASTLPIASGTVITSLLVDRGDPNVVMATAAGTGSGFGIYRSSDRGTNFTPVLSAQATTLIADPDPRSGTLYTSDLQGTCFDRSLNRGATWNRLCLLAPPGGMRLAFDLSNPNALWGATPVGVYRSLDRGQNWDPRFGSARATLSAPSAAYEFTLAPGTQGRLELPLRVLETDRWTVPLTVTTSGEPWLTVSDASGSTPATAQIRVSAANLAPGAYSAEITIASTRAANSPVRVPLRLTVRAPAPELSYTVSTYAGTGQSGTFGDGGPATRAAFGNPDSIAVDAAGSLVLSDPTNNAVRKVTSSGIISRAAGNGQAAFSGDGGEATLAALRGPRGVGADASGRIYIADTGNDRVRRVSTEGLIETVATGVSGGRGIAVDASGNVYLAFPGEHIVVRVASNGTATRFAGSGASGFRGDGGEARFARLNGPNDVAVNPATGEVYIADSENHRIRAVAPDGRIRTIAGNGSAGFQGDGPDATLLALARPMGVAVDGATGDVVIADTDNHRVRVVSRDGRLRSIAGIGTAGFSGDTGPAGSAQLRGPVDVAVDRQGNIYIADSLNSRIRRLAAPLAPRVASLAGPEVKLAPGGYFSVYGSDFTAVTMSASSTPFPTAMGGVMVTVNDRHSRLAYVSPTQINALVPVETEAGTARLRILRDGQPGPEIPVEVAAGAPAILIFGANRAVVVNPDGRVNTAETPVASDSVVTVYLTGIGLTDVTVANGEPAPADPLARPILAASATIGGQPAEVLFLGLAPGFVGLAQANVRVPVLEAGDHAVAITVGGAVSNAPVITVR
jgi:uncharacterized protein (TIGR03437 family)